MFNRTLAGAALIVGLGAASLSHALSLGELRLNSALNQPFEAKIGLQDTGNLSSEQITVKLASVDDFEKAGVDYNYLLSKLDFKVSIDENGKGVVRVVTREPIVEPYLNFLVEVRWPAGRMLREYTVLLDLPAVSNARTSAVEAASGGAAAQAAAQTPATREEVVMLEESSSEEQSYSGPKPRDGGDRTSLPPADQATEYRVQHNDMLWDIAATYRPDGATVQQTMLALLKKNPRAFIGDNINRLKSGYVLRLPTAEEAQQVGQPEAVKEISRQNAVWRGEAVPSDGEFETGPQLDATEQPKEGEVAQTPETQSRLSIATPGAASSEGTDGDVQKLRDDLAANQENLDKVQRENTELNSRLEDLERQLATLQRLLELKDDQLATMQQQMGEEPAPEVKPEVAPAQAPEADGGNLLDNPLVRYGALALVLIGLIVVLLRRRSQSKTEAAFAASREGRADDDLRPESDFNALSDEDDFSSLGENDEQDDDEVGHTTLIIEPNRAEQTTEAAKSEDTGDFDDFDELLSDDPQEDEYSGPDFSSSSPSVEAETDDALAEAEIYVAYGRYDQAAQMLKNAISKEPERTDLRTKLLDVYLETRNKEKFVEEFNALERLGDQDAVAEVKESMSAVEGVSDWLRDDAEVPPPASAAPQVEPSAAVEPEEDENNFDFDLDEDFGETLIREPEATTEETPELDLDADDDLDLSSFDLDDSSEALDGKPGDSSEALSWESPAGVGEAADDEEEISFDLDLEDDLSLDDVAGELESDDDLEASLDEALGDKTPDEQIAGGQDASASENFESLELDDFDLDEELAGFAEGEEAETTEPAASEPPRVGADAKVETPSDDEGFDDLSLDDDPLATGSDERGGLEDFDDDLSDDLGLLGDSDEVATKLDLARAYIDMGDAEGAREMLEEVLAEGNDEQKQDATELLSRL